MEQAQSWSKIRKYCEAELTTKGGAKTIDYSYIL